MRRIALLACALLLVLFALLKSSPDRFAADPGSISLVPLRSGPFATSLLLPSTRAPYLAVIMPSFATTAPSPSGRLPTVMDTQL